MRSTKSRCRLTGTRRLKQVADALEDSHGAGRAGAHHAQFPLGGRQWRCGIVQQDMFYFGGMVRCMRVARMAGGSGQTVHPHISSTGLGYVYMMHFVSAIPNSGPYHEFKEFNNDLPYSCPTSTLRSDDEGAIKVPTGPGLGVTIDPAYISKHTVVKG